MPDTRTEDFQDTFNPDQDHQAMAKPRQPRRDLKKKDQPTQTQESILAFPGGETPVNPSSENDPAALVPPDGTQEAPVNPSSEGVASQAEDTPKVQQAGRGKRTRASKNTPPKATRKPQDAPGEAAVPDQGGTAIEVQASPQGILEALTDEEAILRDQLEYDVEQGIEGAFKVASALLTIREQRLYRSTHRTYEEYIEDKWQMSSRRARHLTFAAGVVKSLEEAGVAELPQNESQVRGLAGVAPEDQAKVWTEAQKTTGKKQPGRKEVQEAAKKVGRPKGSKNAQKPTPEQKKVQKAVEKGNLPEGTEATFTQVDEGVEAAMVADIDLPDVEWLKQFPIRKELGPDSLVLFDQEALFYRWFSPHRKPLVRNVTSKLAANVLKEAKRLGPYVTRIERALSLADPRTWKVCKPCNGNGAIEGSGPCNDCKNAGYKLS